jgi:hypothetical protein
MEGRSTSYASSQQYETIVTDMISPDDRAKLIVAMSTFRTGAQAKREASSKGLAYTPIDPLGRVGVLKYRGIEVALIFKRNTSKVTVLQMESLAAKPIKDTDESWLFINLLETGRDTLTRELQCKVAANDTAVAQYKGLIANMQQTLDTSIDPELYEAVVKEGQVKSAIINRYARAVERIDPALARKLAGKPIRVRPNRPGAQESRQVKVDRKHAAEEKLRFQRAVREEAKRLLALEEKRREREQKKLAKAAAAASAAAKTSTAKTGKPQVGAKTSKKSKRP